MSLQNSTNNSPSTTTLVSAYPLPPRSIFSDLSIQEIENMTPPSIPTEEIISSNDSPILKDYKSKYIEQISIVKEGHDDFIKSFQEMIKMWGVRDVMEKYILAKNSCLQKIEELERLEVSLKKKIFNKN